MHRREPQAMPTVRIEQECVETQISSQSNEDGRQWCRDNPPKGARAAIKSGMFFSGVTYDEILNKLSRGNREIIRDHHHHRSSERMKLATWLVPCADDEDKPRNKDVILSKMRTLLCACSKRKLTYRALSLRTGRTFSSQSMLSPGRRFTPESLPGYRLKGLM